MVRVLPKNETIRKLLKHPVGGAFRAEGPAEWPSDSFTARRIADGDIIADGDAAAEAAVEKKEEKPAKQSRSRAE